MTLRRLSEAGNQRRRKENCSQNKRWQTISIIMSNLSCLTLAFIRKYKEQRGTVEGKNAERDTWGSLSLPLCLSLPSGGQRGKHLKSDASKSDRLTFAFQRGWLWREEIGSWAARTFWQDGRGDGRGPLSPDSFLGSLRTHVCRCVCLAQVCNCVGVCGYVLCVCARVCVRLQKKRCLSWQLAALLDSWCAKFRLLLSNIQTPPKHQPGEETPPPKKQQQKKSKTKTEKNPFWPCGFWAADTLSAEFVCGSDHR